VEISRRAWVAVYGLALLALLGYAVRTTYVRPNEGDLRVYYDVVPRVEQGLDLYHHRESATPERPTAFIYPPPFAVVFLPLTWFPFSAVRLLWCLGMGLIAARACQRAWQLVNRERGPPPRPWLCLAVGLAISLRFVLSDLGHGQVNLLVIGLALEGAALAEEERPRLAALCLALAVVFKLTPAVLVLGWLVARRQRLVAWTAGLGAALLLLPSLVFGVGRNLEYLLRFVTEVTPWNARQHAFVPNNASLSSWLHRLLVGQAEAGATPQRMLASLPPGAVDALTSALGLVVLGVVLWRVAPRDGRPGPATRAAALLAAIPLVSPVAWKPHLVCLILPGMLAARGLTRPGPQRVPLGLGALLTVGTTKGLLGRGLGEAAVLWGALTLGLAFLLVGLLIDAAHAEAVEAEAAA
jgi:alpha-1,2-mannosyltransferase